MYLVTEVYTVVSVFMCAAEGQRETRPEVVQRKEEQPLTLRCSHHLADKADWWLNNRMWVNMFHTDNFSAGSQLLFNSSYCLKNLEGHYL